MCAFTPPMSSSHEVHIHIMASMFLQAQGLCFHFWVPGRNNQHHYQSFPNNSNGLSSILVVWSCKASWLLYSTVFCKTRAKDQGSPQELGQKQTQSCGKVLRAEDSGKGELQSVEFPWQRICGSPITYSLFGIIPYTSGNTEHLVFLGHKPLLWQAWDRTL